MACILCKGPIYVWEIIGIGKHIPFSALIDALFRGFVILHFYIDKPHAMSQSKSRSNPKGKGNLASGLSLKSRGPVADDGVGGEGEDTTPGVKQIVSITVPWGSQNWDNHKAQKQKYFTAMQEQKVINHFVRMSGFVFAEPTHLMQGISLATSSQTQEIPHQRLGVTSQSETDPTIIHNCIFLVLY